MASFQLTQPHGEREPTIRHHTHTGNIITDDILLVVYYSNPVQFTAADLAKQSLSRGFPRVIRAGHGIKIGAVVSVVVMTLYNL